jgi:exodeoxyribonuclease X
MTIVRTIDFETTSLSPEDGSVIEVGYSDYNVETKAISDPVSWLCYADHIPPENRAVHHITLDEIGECAPFDGHAFIGECKVSGVAAIVAHNASFEASWLPSEIGLPLICTYKAGLRAWPDAPSHANTALAYWLEDASLITLDHAKIVPTHRAGPDAYVTAHILKALFDTGITGREMVAWTKESAFMPRITFGKHKGEWKDAPTSYLGWIIGSDLSDDIKWNARREIERRNGESQ